MTLFIGRDGAPVGEFAHKQLAWDFQSSVLPSWMTTAANSGGSAGATYVHSTSEPMERLIVTPAVVGGSSRSSRIGTADLSVTGLRMARLRCVFKIGTSPDLAGVMMQLIEPNVNLTTNGAAFGRYDLTGFGSVPVVSATNASTTRFLTTRLPDIVRGKVYDLSLWLDLTSKMITVGVGDRPWDQWDASAWMGNLATLSARLIMQNYDGFNTTTDNNLSVYKFQLDRWF